MIDYYKAYMELLADLIDLREYSDRTLAEVEKQKLECKSDFNSKYLNNYSRKLEAEYLVCEHFVDQAKGYLEKYKQG